MMTISSEDIRLLELEIHRDVRAALDRFKTRTGGLTPSGIKIEMQDVTNYWGETPSIRRFALGRVDVEMKL